MSDYSIPDSGYALPLENLNNSLNLSSQEWLNSPSNFVENEGSLLGIYTTIASTASESHPERVKSFFSPKWDYTSQRFFLQSVARDFLPDERVAFCLRSTMNNGTQVSIDYSETWERAYYSNLVVCGRVWQCPVCASKISESRRVEMALLLERVRTAGHSTFMVTYTLRHHLGDKLADLHKKLTEARRFLKAGRFWQDFKSEFDLVGSVRASELTYGSNGWHPHFHELFISRSPVLDIPRITTALRSRWSQCAVKYGFDSSWAHGVDVRASGLDVENYINKFGRLPRWREEHEIAKQVSKIARSDKGFTPFQLLQAGADGTMLPGGRSPRSAFREYHDAYQGKNQLFWSKGLRKAYALDVEESDEDLAASMPDDIRLLSLIDQVDWALVLRYSQRAELLRVASLGDGSLVVQFIHNLRKRFAQERAR